MTESQGTLIISGVQYLIETGVVIVFVLSAMLILQWLRS